MNVKGKKLSGIFENEKLIKIIIIIGIIAIAVIFLSSITDFDNSKQEDDVKMYSVEQYRTTLEKSISEMLSCIDGVGNVRVLITMENSTEQVYLQNSTDTKTKEIEPKIRGAVVACSGGANPVTADKVTETVTKALAISSSKVCVCKLSE